MLSHRPLPGTAQPQADPDKLLSLNRLKVVLENRQLEKLEWQESLSELRIAALSRRKERRGRLIGPDKDCSPSQGVYGRQFIFTRLAPAAASIWKVDAGKVRFTLVPE